MVCFSVPFVQEDWEHVPAGESPKFHVSFETTSWLGRRSMPRRPDAKVSFEISLSLHHFPPPGPPEGLAVRNGLNEPGFPT